MVPAICQVLALDPSFDPSFIKLHVKHNVCKHRQQIDY